VSLVITERAYTEPLDQQDGSPLLQLPSPVHRGRKPRAMLAEGLRMSPRDALDANRSERPRPGESVARRSFEHKPVMLEEVVDILSVVPPGRVLDATVGGGGHARALLERNPRLSVVGLDRDAEAVAAAKEVLAPFGERAVVVKRRFDRLDEVLAEYETGSLSGALFDLGVSSVQFDTPERGFSYRFDAPLDMRMDRSEGLTAAQLINDKDADELARLFSLHGESRFGRRIAAALVEARPVLTTRQLADIVSSAVPAPARRRGHPARRVFQAVRAAVNSELEVLPVAIGAALESLAPGGRIVVISYHSGEDRAVKEQLLYAATGGCTCPAGLPCVCGAVPRARLLNRGARKPSASEIAANPRAESARFRAAEAIALPDRRVPGGPLPGLGPDRPQPRGSLQPEAPK
jgi:16S rRNA (cytosine1402-N4)-methyltransferase